MANEDLKELYPNLTKRLESFRGLEDKWNGYGAQAIEDADIGLAYDVLEELYNLAEKENKLLPEPFASVGAGGGNYPIIQYEWTIGEKEFELEFSRTPFGPLEERKHFGWLLARSQDERSWEEGEFDVCLEDRLAIKEFISWLPDKE